MAQNGEREQWGSKIGLILAVAGNAVGLGNFLRFPVQAAQNGGGAYMIPYFIFFLLLGIPLMWIEWGIGRYGGKFKHGSAPGMFDEIWKNSISKYFGSLGLLISLIILIYYTYIESWTLGFSFFSLFGMFSDQTVQSMPNFVSSYQGITHSNHFTSILTSYGFMVVTFGLNFWILYRGISQGIEKLAKIAMPLLFLFGIVIMVRVFMLGTPDPTIPENSVMNGLAFIWNPDFSKLGNPSIWLAAAGQIFFTLSVGMGTIQAYASYLKPKDDIVLSGLATSSTNEFAEVILGGSIAIPIAVAFFGLNATQEFARGGAFNLGFVVMPVIFGTALPLGEIFGFLWFLLLFFAGITSSVAMGQPIVAFLEDEFGMSRKKAVIALGIVVLISVQFVIFFLKYGFLDEMDYWAGTFGLVVFALIETVLFMWVFGAEKAWNEMNEGGEFKIPKLFFYIMRYVTPFLLFGIMIWWFIEDAYPKLLLENVSVENVPYIWGSRILMIVLTISIVFLVKKAWDRKKLVK